MSDGDDPFAKADRTIIRPNPGGRLPQTPAPAPAAPPPFAPPPQGGAPPISRPVSSVAYPSHAAPPAAPAQGEGDAWMVGRVGQSLSAVLAPRRRR